MHANSSILPFGYRAAKVTATEVIACGFGYNPKRLCSCLAKITATNHLDFIQFDRSIAKLHNSLATNHFENTIRFCYKFTLNKARQQGYAKVNVVKRFELSNSEV